MIPGPPAFDLSEPLSKSALTTEEAVIHEESSAPAAHASTEERPCACYGGLVFIDHMVAGEDGEVEAFEAVPCRRCAR